eukprot:5140713-Alexandrium_andersonii.AAC.1
MCRGACLVQPGRRQPDGAVKPGIAGLSEDEAEADGVVAEAGLVPRVLEPFAKEELGDRAGNPAQHVDHEGH